MADINVRAGDYNDGYKAVFSGGGYVFSPSDEWVALGSALPGEFVYKLNANNKENNVTFKGVTVAKNSDPVTYQENESISLQDRAIAAVDAAIEDAFERVAEAAEEDQDSDAYDRGYADGAAGHLVQFNQGYAAGYRFATTEDDTEAGSQGSYNRGYEDGFEAGAAEADKVQYNQGYVAGVKEERERYAEARAAISNSSAALAELQKGVYKAYDLVCALHWEAKAGSKAEASLIKVLDVFEDDSALFKALND